MIFGGFIHSLPLGLRILALTAFVIAYVLFAWKILLPLFKWWIKSWKRVFFMWCFWTTFGVFVLTTQKHDFIWSFYWFATVYFAVMAIFTFKNKKGYDHEQRNTDESPDSSGTSSRSGT